MKDDAYTDLYTAFATGELRATPPTVLCSVPLKHIIQENGKFCGFRFHPFLCRCRTGMVIYMKKNLTELVFILDRSGSMAGLEADTIGGFNAMMEKQRGEPGEAIISTVLFDNESEVIHDRIPMNRVPALTEREYYVRGCTALLDAVGGAIHHIGNVHKYAREEDRPEKILFVITTDGMENTSRRYTYDKVKAMIERQQEKYGWEFLFLGANIDAAQEAARFGIRADRAANYHADGVGTGVIYEAVSEAVCQVRSCATPLSSDWKQKIDEDFKGRKR